MTRSSKNSLGVKSYLLKNCRWSTCWGWITRDLKVFWKDSNDYIELNSFQWAARSVPGIHHGFPECTRESARVLQCDASVIGILSTLSSLIPNYWAVWPCWLSKLNPNLELYHLFPLEKRFPAGVIGNKRSWFWWKFYELIFMKKLQIKAILDEDLVITSAPWISFFGVVFFVFKSQVLVKSLKNLGEFLDRLIVIFWIFLLWPLKLSSRTISLSMLWRIHLGWIFDDIHNICVLFSRNISL